MAYNKVPLVDIFQNFNSKGQINTMLVSLKVEAAKYFKQILKWNCLVISNRKLCLSMCRLML